MQKKGCEGKSLHCKVWWLTNSKMTVKVTVNSAGIIIEAAPVVSKFIGQELRNLCMLRINE